MLKSSNTLLIAGGDSWTDKQGTEWYSELEIKIWPEIVAEIFEWDLVNTGTGGSGQDFIFNNVVDAIYKNKDKYENIIVMVLWSECKRLNFYNQNHWPSPQFIASCEIDNLEKKQESIKQFGRSGEIVHTLADQIIEAYSKEWTLDNYNLTSIQSFVYGAIDNTYRHMYLLDDFCRLNNIKILHGKALHTESNIKDLLSFFMNWPNPDEEMIRYKESIQKESIETFWKNKCREIKNVVGNTNLVEVIPEIWILENRYRHLNWKTPCYHPNQEGHNIIAQRVINSWDMHVTTMKNTNLTNPTYIYD